MFVADSLSRKEKQLKELVSRTGFAEPSADKRSLFKKPVPGAGLADMGTTGWGDVGGAAGGGATGGDETPDTAGVSAQTLKERQQEALKEQVGRAAIAGT